VRASLAGRLSPMAVARSLSPPPANQDSHSLKPILTHDSGFTPRISGSSGGSARRGWPGQPDGVAQRPRGLGVVGTARGVPRSPRGLFRLRRTDQTVRATPLAQSVNCRGHPRVIRSATRGMGRNRAQRHAGQRLILQPYYVLQSPLDCRTVAG
jgi:hypothetical protein